MSISNEEANMYISEYIAIKKSLVSSDGFKNSTDAAKNYYSSGLDSFVFAKDRIQALWQDSRINAIRIYYGAISGGAPTIVLVGCSINGAEIVNVKIGTSVAAEETPLPPTIRRGPSPKFPFDITDDNIPEDNLPNASNAVVK